MTGGLWTHRVSCRLYSHPGHLHAVKVTAKSQKFRQSPKLGKVTPKALSSESKLLHHSNGCDSHILAPQAQHRLTQVLLPVLFRMNPDYVPFCQICVQWGRSF